MVGCYDSWELSSPWERMLVNIESNLVFDGWQILITHRYKPQPFMGSWDNRGWPCFVACGHDLHTCIANTGGDSLLSSKLSFYVIVRHPMKVNNRLLIFLQERQWTWCIFLAHLTQFDTTRVWQLKQHSILRVFKILASSILLSCAYNSNLENISKILVSNIRPISVQCTQGWAV